MTGEGKRKRVLDSADELVATLSDEFKLTVPEAAGLWGKICERHEELSTRNQEADP